LETGSRLQVLKLSPAEQHTLDAEEVMSLCIYNGADPTRRAAALAIYDNPDNCLVGARCKEELVGLVGICPKEGGMEIRHIAVALKQRRHGIGATLINYVRTLYPDKNRFAETDGDSVSFYRKHGFTCNSIGEKYP
jgi:N-acetylglutamate synthase-like GNAT family acetyltransferase